MTPQAIVSAISALTDQTARKNAIVKKTGAEIGALAAGGAYSAGDTIGVRFAVAAIRKEAGSAIIRSISVRDLDKQNSVLKIILFDADPTGTTFTDNAALDLADADITKVIGVIPVAAADYTSLNDNSVGHVGNLNIPIQVSSGASIYAVVVSGGTPTYGDSALSLSFNIEQE